MPKKKDYCLNLEKCWYPALHHKMERLLLLCCCFIYNWVLFAQKDTVLSTLQRNALIDLYRRQWTQDGKVTKIPIQVSSVVAETMNLPANSSYGYQIMDRSRHTVAKYLTDEKHMRPILVNCSKSYNIWTIYCMKLNSPKHRLNTRANHCRVLHFPIRKVANIGAVLQLLHRILWCKQVWRVRNGHRFAVTCSCRERTGRLYKTWNES